MTFLEPGKERRLPTCRHGLAWVRRPSPNYRRRAVSITLEVGRLTDHAIGLAPRCLGRLGSLSGWLDRNDQADSAPTGASTTSVKQDHDQAYVAFAGGFTRSHGRAGVTEIWTSPLDRRTRSLRARLHGGPQRRLHPILCRPKASCSKAAIGAASSLASARRPRASWRRLVRMKFGGTGR